MRLFYCWKAICTLSNKIENIFMYYNMCTRCRNGNKYTYVVYSSKMHVYCFIVLLYNFKIIFYDKHFENIQAKHTIKLISFEIQCSDSTFVDKLFKSQQM
jgi:hypothetical protein